MEPVEDLGRMSVMPFEVDLSLLPVGECSVHSSPLLLLLMLPLASVNPDKFLFNLFPMTMWDMMRTVVVKTN